MTTATATKQVRFLHRQEQQEESLDEIMSDCESSACSIVTECYTEEGMDGEVVTGDSSSTSSTINNMSIIDSSSIYSTIGGGGSKALEFLYLAKMGKEMPRSSPPAPRPFSPSSSQHRVTGSIIPSGAARSRSNLFPSTTANNYYTGVLSMESNQILRGLEKFETLEKESSTVSVASESSNVALLRGKKNQDTTTMTRKSKSGKGRSSATSKSKIKTRNGVDTLDAFYGNDDDDSFQPIVTTKRKSNKKNKRPSSAENEAKALSSGQGKVSMDSPQDSSFVAAAAAAAAVAAAAVPAPENNVNNDAVVDDSDSIESFTNQVVSATAASPARSLKNKNTTETTSIMPSVPLASCQDDDDDDVVSSSKNGHSTSAADGNASNIAIANNSDKDGVWIMNDVHPSPKSPFNGSSRDNNEPQESHLDSLFFHDSGGSTTASANKDGNGNGSMTKVPKAPPSVTSTANSSASSNSDCITGMDKTIMTMQRQSGAAGGGGKKTTATSGAKKFFQRTFQKKNKKKNLSTTTISSTTRPPAYPAVDGIFMNSVLVTTTAGASSSSTANEPEVNTENDNSQENTTNDNVSTKEEPIATITQSMDGCNESTTIVSNNDNEPLLQQPAQWSSLSTNIRDLKVSLSGDDVEVNSPFKKSEPNNDVTFPSLNASPATSTGIDLGNESVEPLTIEVSLPNTTTLPGDESVDIITIHRDEDRESIPETTTTTTTTTTTMATTEDVHMEDEFDFTNSVGNLNSSTNGSGIFACGGGDTSAMKQEIKSVIEDTKASMKRINMSWVKSSLKQSQSKLGNILFSRSSTTTNKRPMEVEESELNITVESSEESLENDSHVPAAMESFEMIL